MTLAKRIRDCRYAKGWGPDELATRAEISRTALYQIECGRTETPRAATLRRIARALNVSIEILLNDESGHVLPFTAMQQEGVQSAHDGNCDAAEHVPSPYVELLPEAPEQDLYRKFQEVLISPLGAGVARIVEESHRLLPCPQVVSH